MAAEDNVGTAGVQGNEGGAQELEELLVDGQAVKVTRDQLKADAQKARSVLPQLQSEHDKLKNEHEELTERTRILSSFVEDFENVLKGGEGGKRALQRMSQATGVSPRELVKQIAGSAGLTPKRTSEQPRTKEEEDDGGEDLFESEPERRATSPSTAHQPVKMEDIDPELAKDLAYARRLRLGRFKDDLHGELRAAFEHDDKLSKILKGSEKQAGTVLSLGQKALQRRVFAEKAEPGPRLYREIAAEVAELLDNLGIQAEDGKEPRKELRAYGIGETGYDFSEDDLHQEQPPKRVPITSGNYRKNFAERLLHRIIKAGGLAPPEQE